MEEEGQVEEDLGISILSISVIQTRYLEIFFRMIHPFLKISLEEIETAIRAG